MILLYNFIEEHRNQIFYLLMNKIPKEVRPYSRIPRHDLRSSLEHLLDAYLDYLVTNDHTSLKTHFRYLARLRHSQSISQSTIVRALLCLPSVIRQLLQEGCRTLDVDGKTLFNQTMAHVERTIFDAIALFIDVYNDYLQSKVDEHNTYLDERTKSLGVDLSKFILFRG